jgi:hypothetical protein
VAPVRAATSFRPGARPGEGYLIGRALPQGERCSSDTPHSPRMAIFPWKFDIAP